MSAKAILRTAKLKSLSNIAGSASHVMRQRETPNADPERYDSNLVLVGSGDIRSDIEARLPEKRRKNAVLAVEHVLTASPEWFKDKSPDEVMKWAEASVASMRSFWGDENVVSAVLHLDEATPHLHLYTVPIDPESGRLNARGFIGGRDKLSALQDHYAKDMAKFKLERGIKGSKAKHTRVKEFYANLENPPKLKYVEAEVVVQEKGFGVLRPKTEVRKFPSWESAKAVQTLASETLEYKRKVEQYQNTAKTLEREKARLERERLRQIPLVELAQELGLERDKHDRKKWKAPDGRHINIDGQKFYDLDEGKGGGGAIDFAMHVLGCDFKDAIGWLKSRYGVDEIADEIAASARKKAKRQVEQVEKKEFIPPKRDDSKWPRARAYLAKRGIDLPYPTPTIYADDKGNVVFLGKGRAELVGTGANKFKGLAAGSSKDSSGFIAGDWKNAEKIAVVESAIDALSYVELHPDQAAVSSAGTPSDGFLRNFLEWVRDIGKTPILAFDNDQKGWNFLGRARSIARKVFFGDIPVDDLRLRAVVGEAKPPAGKDWNDALQEQLAADDAPSDPAKDFSFPSRDM